MIPAGVDGAESGLTVLSSVKEVDALGTCNPLGHVRAIQARDTVERTLRDSGRRRVLTVRVWCLGIGWRGLSMVPMAIARDGLPHRKPCRPTGRAARRHRLGRPSDLLGGRVVWEITSHSGRRKENDPTWRAARHHPEGRPSDLLGGRGVWEITSHSWRRWPTASPI